MKKLIILTPVLAVLAMTFLSSCASHPTETTTTTTTHEEAVTGPGPAGTPPMTMRQGGGY